MIKDRSNQGIHCKYCSFRNLCVARSLSEDEKNEVNKIITKIYMIEKGEHVFHANETMNNLFAVYSGYCKDYWLDEFGNECIDNFYFPGDLIGLESIPKRQYSFSAVALTTAQLCVIPIEPLLELMQKSDNLLKRFVHIASYKMQNDKHIRITTNAKQRVADFLLNILYRLEERKIFRGHISLPMSQFDISNFLGMAHETVSRVLRCMHREQIIEISNKEIYIKNVDQLKGLGNQLHSSGQV